MKDTWSQISDKGLHKEASNLGAWGMADMYKRKAGGDEGVSPESLIIVPSRDCSASSLVTGEQLSSVKLLDKASIIAYDQV